jgi:ubiquinone/menaquinone biosynthesis C-methylase UbiE
VDAASSLGTSRRASMVRAALVPLVFEGMESAFALREDPVPIVQRMLSDAANAMAAMTGSGLAALGAAVDHAQRSIDAVDTGVAATTGAHYGRLFERFSSTSFWDEPRELLRTRLERNGIPLDCIRDRSVLDAGCGGGRYSVAWRLLGAGSVTGLDVSATGIGSARDRVLSAGIDGVSFGQGNVLDLPCEDNAFDIVFSNGVLHHTVEWQRGVQELVRVLHPGGMGWLYLIEKPGGLFWDLIEILRVVMRGENSERARTVLQSLGFPANRVFYMLDHVMVPINTRLTADEITHELDLAGASSIRRLERGVDFDRVEAIHRGDPFVRVKYGAGEQRFVFSKERLP